MARVTFVGGNSEFQTVAAAVLKLCPGYQVFLVFISRGRLQRVNIIFLKYN